MAGYVGTKAVLLSTTAANVGGDADIGGALDVGGAFTSQGIDDNATSTAMTLDASGNVGIGTTSPDRPVHLSSAGNRNYFKAETTGSANSSESGFEIKTPSSNWLINSLGATDALIFYDLGNTSEAMRIDSGNVYVGGTTYEGSTTSNASSSYHGASGFISANVNNDFGMQVNRTGTDGTLFNFRKNGTDVGMIGNLGTTLFIQTSGNQAGLGFYSGHVSPRKNNAASDNAIDLGRSSQRYDDIFATNGTIQTSDRNEKQDIAELSDAEQRVSVAAKGLMRKFRWRDAVEAKGDAARIHFGIIAQDLQAAFASEGLDASRYAMFCSNTWWEHDVEVPAVEAVAEVLDEEGNVVTEAVEAKDAYTRTDAYDTQEEAPEGATERTRLGVRYSELLAFIIGAL
ncbi:tail fiber domain-containing protein [Alphaproteobacteria bacterium US3C007]|nr:tail fiber domain-containing protein [Alphaproteobacteria bacterium US3C007]